MRDPGNEVGRNWQKQVRLNLPQKRLLASWKKSFYKDFNFKNCLQLNNFTFEYHNFTVMGTRAAPNFSNVYMARFEDTFEYRTEWSYYIIDWVRFTDDIFLIWKGYASSLTTFREHLNSVEPSIKFTHEISYKSVNFLDTKVIKGEQGHISTNILQKPTDTHPYIHWTSAHPPHLKQSIPYSQTLRLRRICSSTSVLEQRIGTLSNRRRRPDDGDRKRDISSRHHCACTTGCDLTLPWSRGRENVGFHVATKTWVLDRDLFFWSLFFFSFFSVLFLCRTKVKLHNDCL